MLEDDARPAPTVLPRQSASAAATGRVPWSSSSWARPGVTNGPQGRLSKWARFIVVHFGAYPVVFVGSTGTKTSEGKPAPFGRSTILPTVIQAGVERPTPGLISHVVYAGCPG